MNDVTEFVERTAVSTVAPGRAVFGGMLRPVAPIADELEAQKYIRDLIRKGLTNGRDFGVIPGTQKRPKLDENGQKIARKGGGFEEEEVRSLLKAGAEKINKAYGLYAEYVVIEKESDHDRVVHWKKRSKKWRNATPTDKSFEWEETNGESIGVYRYVVDCILIHRGTGAIVGRHVGTCSSLESKYVDRPRDVENTVLKMACKRSYVAVTLNVHALSDEFTQDLEDDPDTETEIEKREKEQDFKDARKEDPTLPRPPANLAECEAMLFPGTKSTNNPWGGRPLRDVPSKVLSRGMEFLSKHRETGEMLDVKELSMADRSNITAMGMILDDRAEKAEQLKAEQEAQIAAAKAAKPEPAKTPASDMPKEPESKGAEQSLPDLPKSLQDDLDDLPF